MIIVQICSQFLCRFEEGKRLGLSSLPPCPPPLPPSPCTPTSVTALEPVENNPRLWLSDNSGKHVTSYVPKCRRAWNLISRTIDICVQFFRTLRMFFQFIPITFHSRQYFQDIGNLIQHWRFPINLLKSFDFMIFLCTFLGVKFAQTVTPSSRHALWPVVLWWTISSGCAARANIEPTSRRSTNSTTAHFAMRRSDLP